MWTKADKSQDLSTSPRHIQKRVRNCSTSYSGNGHYKVKYRSCHQSYVTDLMATIIAPKLTDLLIVIKIHPTNNLEQIEPVHVLLAAYKGLKFDIIFSKFTVL